MSQYLPRGDSLKVVKHEPGPHGSGPYYMIHDDHGKYDGPYNSEHDAQMHVHSIEQFNKEARDRYKRTGSLI
jgi:hypothetical protein